jgi:digeranylgeranylglycerophospholipid reductase
MYDALISGAGPAGSKCAEVLAKDGFKVALIERNSAWRKPCGGATSSRILKYYPQLRNLDLHPITGISMYSGDFHKLKYSWKDIREPSFTVDRLEFDTILRNVAIDAGTELIDKNLSYDFVYKQNRKIGIKTKYQNETKEYLGKVLIIADGMGSKLAFKSKLRDKWKIDGIGLAKCAIMDGENNIDKSSISLFFQKYKGYGWIFPLGENRFNIGCGTWLEANRIYNINQVYRDFQNNPYLDKFFPNRNFKKVWEGAYPLPALGVNESSLFKDNIMMIGDTAGFVSPISGEGIHASIVSGQIAGETASYALENDDISDKSLKKYKSHPNIKKIRRNFKMTASMVDFLYEDDGKNLSNMFSLAKTDEKIQDIVINMFLFGQPPSREFLLRLKSMRQKQ